MAFRPGQQRADAARPSLRVEVTRGTGLKLPSWLPLPLLVGLALAGVTCAVFWPVGACDFVEYDDFLYVKHNPHVQGGLHLANLGWAFLHGYQGNWHPLTWISHMADVELFGSGAGGPHAINLLLHAANTVLLFAFLRKATGALWRSALVAALFALHPLHVESVAWVAERKDVLSTFFALLTLLAYDHYVAGLPRDRSSQGGGARDNLWMRPLRSARYWVVLVLFVLGLMSKPMLVTLPCVLLLLDYWPLNRLKGSSAREFAESLRPLLWEKLPLLTLSGICCTITVITQKPGWESAGIPLAWRVGNVCVAYTRYLGKTFWPADLAVLYPFPGPWPLGLSVGSAVLVAALFAGALWTGRQARFVTVGWFWFVGVLVPVIGLIQVGKQSMADRYTYLPLVGIFIVLTWGAVELFRRWQWRSWPLALLAGLLLVGCAFQTRRQLAYWKNTETLFTHALAVRNGNAPTIGPLLSYHYYDRGNAAREAGRLDEAIALYQKALGLNGSFAPLHNNLGLTFQAQGLLNQAIQEHLAAVRLSPTNISARNNLAVAFTRSGKLDEAILQFNELLRLDPTNAQAHNNLGSVLGQKGNYAEAIEQFKAALRLLPNNPVLYENLGDALSHQGNREAAIACYQRAVRLNPSDARASQRLQALQGKAP